MNLFFLGSLICNVFNKGTGAFSAAYSESVSPLVDSFEVTALALVLSLDSASQIFLRRMLRLLSVTPLSSPTMLPS